MKMIRIIIKIMAVVGMVGVTSGCAADGEVVGTTDLTIDKQDQMAICEKNYDRKKLEKSTRDLTETTYPGKSIGWMLINTDCYLMGDGSGTQMSFVKAALINQWGEEIVQWAMKEIGKEDITFIEALPEWIDNNLLKEENKSMAHRKVKFILYLHEKGEL